METVKVVNAFDGTCWERVKVDPVRGGVWFLSHLKKDGGFPGNRNPDGELLRSRSPYSHYDAWAIYDSEREARATVIRGNIAALQAKLQGETERLLDVYLGQKDAQPS